METTVTPVFADEGAEVLTCSLSHSSQAGECHLNPSVCDEAARSGLRVGGRGCLGETQDGLLQSL